MGAKRKRRKGKKKGGTNPTAASANSTTIPSKKELAAQAAAEAAEKTEQAEAKAKKRAEITAAVEAAKAKAKEEQARVAALAEEEKQAKLAAADTRRTQQAGRQAATSKKTTVAISASAPSTAKHSTRKPTTAAAAVATTSSPVSFHATRRSASALLLTPSERTQLIRAGYSEARVDWATTQLTRAKAMPSIEQAKEVLAARRQEDLEKAKIAAKGFDTTVEILQFENNALAMHNSIVEVNSLEFLLNEIENNPFVDSGNDAAESLAISTQAAIQFKEQQRKLEEDSKASNLQKRKIQAKYKAEAEAERQRLQAEEAEKLALERAEQEQELARIAKLPYLIRITRDLLSIAYCHYYNSNASPSTHGIYKRQQALTVVQKISELTLDGDFLANATTTLAHFNSRVTAYNTKHHIDAGGFGTFNSNCVNILTRLQWLVSKTEALYGLSTTSYAEINESPTLFLRHCLLRYIIFTPLHEAIGSSKTDTVIKSTFGDAGAKIASKTDAILKLFPKIIKQGDDFDGIEGLLSTLNEFNKATEANQSSWFQCAASLFQSGAEAVGLAEGTVILDAEEFIEQQFSSNFTPISLSELISQLRAFCKNQTAIAEQESTKSAAGAGAGSRR